MPITYPASYQVADPLSGIFQTDYQTLFGDFEYYMTGESVESDGTTLQFPLLFTVSDSVRGAEVCNLTITSHAHFQALESSLTAYTGQWNQYVPADY